MILIIDNYDSFTYNLVRYLQLLNLETRVIRNNEMTIAEISKLSFSHLLLSPGPGTPNDAGICLQAIDYFKDKVPIFGVCLGLQCIAQSFGGQIIHAPQIIHGKSSQVYHQGTGSFQSLPNPFIAGRYHSLVADTHIFPECLEITAWSGTSNNTPDGFQGEGYTIMGIRHRKFLIEAVQFHPESVLTEHGLTLLSNFFQVAARSPRCFKYNYTDIH